MDEYQHKIFKIKIPKGTVKDKILKINCIHLTKEKSKKKEVKKPRRGRQQRARGTQASEDDNPFGK